MQRRLTTAPPHLYFVVSAVFGYLGPAFAVLLFARVDVLGVAWLRVALVGVFLALWRRARRRTRSAGTTARRGCRPWRRRRRSGHTARALRLRRRAVRGLMSRGFC